MHINTHITIANHLPAPRQTVHFVEPDIGARTAMAQFLRDNGFDVAEYDDHQEFLTVSKESQIGCVVLTAVHNGEGVEPVLYPRMLLPVIIVSQVEDVRASVDAIKSGAVDVLMKPVDGHALLRAVATALDMEGRIRARRLVRQMIVESANTLTRRERQVFEAVTSGLMNKQIAYDLGISEIMVKVHRGRVMRKMSSRTLPDLVRKYDIVQAVTNVADGSYDMHALN